MDLTFQDTFNISAYGGKLFKADPVKLDYTLNIPDLTATTPEGKEVQKIVNAAWTVKMAAWKKDKEKEYKEILKLTEKALLESSKKKAPELLKQAKGDKTAGAKLLAQWLGEEAKGANVMIKNALSTFEGVCQKFMLELWAKVAAGIDKKFKTAITKAKVKAVLKIVGLSILIVAAAALTIAGAVLAAVAAPTGIGTIAGLGLAAGGIVTISKAIAEIYGVYDKTYPDHKKAAKNLRDKVQILSDAFAYEEKKADKASRGEKLGPKEKIKLMLGNTKGKQKDVLDALKQLSMWTGKMVIDIEKGGQAESKLAAKLDELDAALKKASDPKQVAVIKKQQEAGVTEITKLFRARENARGYLSRYNAICEEAAKVMADGEKLTSTKLGALAGKVEALMSSKEMETFITIGKGSVEFMKGFMKFASM
ncbi:MAG: hypothetical protein EON93_01370 [Burkholderiales bacterium]|nr:MAG: hypothetical protein EON93_01370 [Burkholderiales bacterium]